MKVLVRNRLSDLLHLARQRSQCTFYLILSVIHGGPEIVVVFLFGYAREAITPQGQ